MFENLSFLAKAGNIVPARSSWSTVSRFNDGLTNLHSVISNGGRLSSVDPFIPFTRTIVICFDVIENTSLIICLQIVVVSNGTPVKKYWFYLRKFRYKVECISTIEIIYTAQWELAYFVKFLEIQNKLTKRWSISKISDFI